MDRPASPSLSASASDLVDDTAPPSPSSAAAPSPQASETVAAVEARKKKSRKKRKPLLGEESPPGEINDGPSRKAEPKKKRRKVRFPSVKIPLWRVEWFDVIVGYSVFAHSDVFVLL